MSQKATHLAFPCFKVIWLVLDWLLSLSSRCKLRCYTLILTPSLFSLSLSLSLSLSFSKNKLSLLRSSTLFLPQKTRYIRPSYSHFLVIFVHCFFYSDVTYFILQLPSIYIVQILLCPKEVIRAIGFTHSVRYSFVLNYLVITFYSYLFLASLCL